MSPEVAVSSEWRKMFDSAYVKQQLVLVAVDEAHSDLSTITHWAWMYTHNNLLKHPRTLEFNPRIHLIGYISVAVDSLVPERVPSSSRTSVYESTLLTVGLRNYALLL